MTHHSCVKGMPARLLAFTTALFMVWGITFGLLGQAYAEEGQPASTEPAPTEPAKEEQLLKAQRGSIDKITLTDIDVPAVGQKPDTTGTVKLFAGDTEVSDSGHGVITWKEGDRTLDLSGADKDYVFKTGTSYTVVETYTLGLPKENLAANVTGLVNDRDASVKVDEVEPVITLSYTWNALAMITFNPNEGKGEMDPQSVETLTIINLNENKFTRDGYTFTGWNTKKDGTGKTFKDKDSVKLESDVTLYAQWKKNEEPVTPKVTVTYDANGGTGTMDAQPADQGSDVTLTKNAFTRDGYTFKGWNTDKDGKGGSYSDKQEIKALNQDLTLYAQWEEKAKTATVTFDANGGKGEMDPQTEETGTTVKLNENKFTRSGYTFTGWNTKKDGTGKTFKDKASVKLNSDVTLYAQWKKNSSSNTSSKTSTTTSSKGTLAKTGDQTSFVVVAVLAVIGIVAAVLGLKRRKKSDDNA